MKSSKMSKGRNASQKVGNHWVDSLPIRTLLSRSTIFTWEKIRSTDACVQGRQLMIRNTGCTIGGYLEITSQTFGSFNLPSRSTSTSASANAATSDFADAVADASAAAEFKYASKSGISAADSDAASLPLVSTSASALALSLDMLWMRKEIGWRATELANTCTFKLLPF